MYKEINTTDELRELLVKGGIYNRIAFQDVDFRPMCDIIQECWFSECIFLGGKGISHIRPRTDDKCLIFPSFCDMPFNTFRNSLYTPQDLYSGYRLGEPDSYSESFDSIVYNHYLNAGKLSTGIRETLARFLHDHAMNDAMNDFLESFDEKAIVGIMGGHGLLRTEDMYLKVALISKKLTEAGCLMVSGGGPGAMEATHLGAWFAGKDEKDLETAVKMLSKAPSYKDKLWLETSFRVMEKFPSPKFISLGVPTWLYGHEPATPFATHIAKYFNNSMREDNIITIAKGGIIYSPGSAGTMQEIFQDAVQNHYLSFGYSSPMIFLGNEFWTDEMPVYRLMEHLVEKGKYKNLMLSITDSIENIIETIITFKSKPKSSN